VKTVAEVRVRPDEVRVYAEGWQSWSPTGWWRPGEQPRSAKSWEHAMRFRPGVDADPDVVLGEGLLVVDPGGGPCVSVRLDGPDTIPSIQGVLTGDVVTVAADGPVT
jgi:alpha-galactosidase